MRTLTGSGHSHEKVCLCENCKLVAAKHYIDDYTQNLCSKGKQPSKPQRLALYIYSSENASGPNLRTSQASKGCNRQMPYCPGEELVTHRHEAVHDCTVLCLTHDVLVAD